MQAENATIRATAANYSGHNSQTTAMMNERKEDDNGIGAQAKLKKFVKDHCGYILSFILTVFIHAFKEHASSKISPYIHFLSMEVLVKLALGLGIVSSLLLLLIFCSETRLFGTEKHDLEEAVKAIDIEEYFRSIYCKEEFDKIVGTGEAVVILRVLRGNQSQLSAECFEAYFAAIELLNTRREQNAEKATFIRYVLDFTPNKDMSFYISYKKEVQSKVPVIIEDNGTLVPYSFEATLGKQVKDLSERLTIPHDYPSTTTVEEAQGQANESVSDDYSGE